MGEVVIKEDFAYCSTWVELYVEYKEGLGKLEEYRTFVKEKSFDESSAWDCLVVEVLGSMRNETKAAIMEIKNRAVYEYGAYNKEIIDLPVFTQLQREVLQLRLKYSSYTKIANILGVSPGTVFNAYQAALRKIFKFVEQDNREEGKELSPQQKEIDKMYQAGKKRGEIAEALGLSINSVKTQLKRIREKKKVG